MPNMYCTKYSVYLIVVAFHPMLFVKSQDKSSEEKHAVSLA